ncbi:MAG: hypothetical protein ACRYG4_03005 [Janthinobacterium lividum]
MTLYLTKTWGFSSPSGPLQFSTNGWRTNARNALTSGDMVLIVGTKGSETDEEEQGRILGLMEPTKHVVSSLDYNLIRGPQDLDAAGNYKWPFGLELVRAWRFDDPRPLLTDLTFWRFNMDSAQGIVPLEPSEEASILALPMSEVGLLSAIAARARVEGADAARRKAAPPPATERTGIMHMRRAPAFALCDGNTGCKATGDEGWLGVRLGAARARLQSCSHACDRRASLQDPTSPAVSEREGCLSDGAMDSQAFRSPAPHQQCGDRHTPHPR